MKKAMKLALCMLLCAALAGCASADGTKPTTIVTSFYPMYVFTQNVAKDVPGVNVVNMAGESAGCLHDYQLKTRDMVMLEEASALVINGGGMEQFMDKVIASRPQLPVIDASAGIEMLCMEDGHEHHDHDHNHDHGALNAHVWLDPALAIRQVENIAEGLAQADPANAGAYRANAEAYIARLEALDSELAAILANDAGKEIITFHESFTYFAHAYGLHVAGVISVNSGEEPSTRQIAKVCDLVREKNVKALFVEPQYPAKSAETIARETGAKVYTLYPVVSGDGTPEYYEKVMRDNARILSGALSDE